MLKVANSVINVSQITGVLPVVNGGTGVTTSTGTGNTVLSASPTLSGDVNLSTGNLVIGTAGKGIDFSITSSGTGTMTSELLADYEEGTWSPTDASGASLSLTSVSGKYIRTGNIVNAFFSVTYPATVSGADCTLGSLPFTSIASGVPNPGALTLGFTNSSLELHGICGTSSTSFVLLLNTGTNVINSQLSTRIVRGVFTYLV